MKTWILLAASSGAAVFLYDPAVHRVSLATKWVRPSSLTHVGSPGKRSETFARYLAEEMDLACGEGTNAKLVALGEPDILDSIRRQLSPTTPCAAVRILDFRTLAREMSQLDRDRDQEVAIDLLGLLGLEDHAVA